MPSSSGSSLESDSHFGFISSAGDCKFCEYCILQVYRSFLIKFIAIHNANVE